MGILVSVAAGMVPSKSSELYGPEHQLLLRLEGLSMAIPLPKKYLDTFCHLSHGADLLVS